MNWKNVRHFAFIAVVFITGISANAQSVEIKLSNSYTWTIDIPDGFEITSDITDLANEVWGEDVKEAIEATTGEKVTGEANELFNIEHVSGMALLNVTSTEFSASDGISYDDLQAYEFDSYIATIESLGMPYDVTRRERAIDGYTFNTIFVSVYLTPAKRQVVSHQFLLDRLFEDKSILVTLNFIHTAHIDLLMDAINKSKITRSR